MRKMITIVWKQIVQSLETNLSLLTKVSTPQNRCCFFLTIHSYLISEHWSRYLEVTGTFNGFLRKTLTRLIVKKASFVTTVTKNLADAMKKHGLVNDNYVVLDNVVDRVFYQTAKINTKHKATFINVTCFTDRAKNISGLLRVIKSMTTKRNDFTFILVGEGEDLDKMKDYARKLEISKKQLVFKGLLEGEELVSEMANTDLLVMFSNYENLPVVINESFVLGIPVVSTNVGGIHEILNKSNGVLIDRKDESALEKTLVNYLDGKLKFDKKAIREEFRIKFSPEKIGIELFELYQKALRK
ncbi:TPA: glycosyltransferase [Candidatus Peregrinibacteria bacterium]|nr:glycosyltransferase [Candidatus Peregrinibacteria bacterium]